MGYGCADRFMIVHTETSYSRLDNEPSRWSVIGPFIRQQDYHFFLLEVMA
jgi:hypothetical protein